jgi:TonB family protein
MTNYLLTVVAGILVAWCTYRLFLKGKAAAQTNRIFLLGGLLLPFALPLIPLSQTLVATAQPVLLPTVTITDAVNTFQPANNAFAWLPLVYFGGVLAILAYYASSIFLFFRLMRKATRVVGMRNVYRLPNNGMPFSFFGCIFLADNLSAHQQQLVITHEQWHIRLGHSVDVLLGMAVHSALWFFPVLPFYLRDLRQEHELEVDQRMLLQTPFANYAETLLQVSMLPIQSAQFHSFSHSKLKHRILMMAKTHKQNTWKLLFLIPLACGMMYLNACNKQADMIPAAPDTLTMTEVDIPPQFADCATDESAEKQMQCLFSGLTSVITEKMVYPEIAKKMQLERKVFVQFIIDENGNLRDLKLKQGATFLPGQEPAAHALNQAALAVFEDFPKLIPAQKNGKPVAIEYVVPINFVLPYKEVGVLKAYGPYVPPNPEDGC